MKKFLLAFAITLLPFSAHGDHFDRREASRLSRQLLGASQSLSSSAYEVARTAAVAARRVNFNNLGRAADRLADPRLFFKGIATRKNIDPIKLQRLIGVLQQGHLPKFFHLSCSIER